MGPHVTLILTTLILVQHAFSTSLYEYYDPDGEVTSGLLANGDSFTLNGKDLMIFSGALHYFRIHPDYWRVTLRKIRAAGFNTVETYVPWNLHEPRQGVYDFGDRGEDMSFLLDIRTFIQMAQEEDLFLILRPGPYICSEWDFGGLPSWLLRDYTMQVRTYYEPYRTAVAAYFDVLIPMLADLQFTRGGPIIMVQIENEYGAFGYNDLPRDKLYLEFIKDNLIANGMGESLFFTADGVIGTGDLGSLPGVLMTANFKNSVSANLNKLKQLQPDRPLMVMEFWTGWFDHWLDEEHAIGDVETFGDHLETILQFNSSVNFYMFIGGTNWGFMAGANSGASLYQPDTQSYDYDAPLTESGDYTAKYDLAKEIIAKYNPLEGIVSNPAAPNETEKSANSVAQISDSMDLFTLLNSAPDNIGPSTDLLSMENLPINDNNGQSYGYIVYSTTAFLSMDDSTIKIKGHIRDMAQVILDDVVVTKPYSSEDGEHAFGFWNARNAELIFQADHSPVTLRIMVENLGRVNYGQPHNFKQNKGIVEGPVTIDGVELTEWSMTPLEFKKSFISSLSEWESFTGSYSTPGMYRTTATLDPMDTYLDMSAWNKGVVFINGFNLGRYWSEGPQKTLYLPAPLITNGGDTEMILLILPLMSEGGLFNSRKSKSAKRPEWDKGPSRAKSDPSCWYFQGPDMKYEDGRERTYECCKKYFLKNSKCPCQPCFDMQ